MPCHHPIAHKALILLLHASQHHTSEKQAYYNVFIFTSCIINLTLSVGFSGSNLVTCLFDFFTWLAGGKSNWVKHDFFFSFSLLEGRWGRCDNSWLAVGWVYIHVAINQTHPSPQISTLHGVKILRFKLKDNEFLGGFKREYRQYFCEKWVLVWQLENGKRKKAMTFKSLTTCPSAFLFTLSKVMGNVVVTNIEDE